jgi:hypothetical protein
MTTINEIINAVDYEIKVKRVYLHKKHKNGIFDFQLFGEKLEPYQVLHDKMIYPVINNLIGNKENSIDIMQDVYLLKEWETDDLPNNYFKNGVLARTILLNKDGLFALTNYYKTIAPQSYVLKLELPVDEKIQMQVLQKLAYSLKSTVENKYLEIDIHLPEPARTQMKLLNPGMRFNSKSRFYLEKLQNNITWKEVKNSIVSIINKLDDKCVNIFNRIDHINFLTNNIDEIKDVIDNLTLEEKQDFKTFHKENKDWFNLIVEGIDLTKNKYYKDLVNEEEVKQQSSDINEIIQYITLHVILEKNIVR